jgi:hypothetical protein
MRHHKDNVEARKLVSDAPSTCGSPGAEHAAFEYVKPNAALGNTGNKL